MVTHLRTVPDGDSSGVHIVVIALVRNTYSVYKTNLKYIDSKKNTATKQMTLPRGVWAAPN